MSNISRGSLSMDELKEYISAPLTTIYAKYKDNMKVDGDYEFWENIIHPETGESLRAVKGYCDQYGSALNRKCHYAEYQDDKGNSYYYLDTKSTRIGLPEYRKDIRTQINEDRQEYEDKVYQEKIEFLEKFNKTEDHDYKINDEMLYRFGNLGKAQKQEENSTNQESLETTNEQTSEEKAQQEKDIGNMCENDDTSPKRSTGIDNGI